MVSPPAPDFQDFIARLAQGLSAARLPFMLIGGQAVLLHGQPRLTEDIDVTLGVDPSQLPAVQRVCRNSVRGTATVALERNHMMALHYSHAHHTFSENLGEAAMARGKKPGRVREPVQVYLDAQDQDLLERLGTQTGLAKAELLRRGLRRLASDELTERKPGWSFDLLIGALGDDEPTDLSVRHDEYLYGPAPRGSKRPR